MEDEITERILLEIKTLALDIVRSTNDLLLSRNIRQLRRYARYASRIEKLRKRIEGPHEVETTKTAFGVDW
jgi:hypothetical protein